MKTVTQNEARAALWILKDFSNNYNANNLSHELGLSSMGVLKILKRLEKRGVLKSKKFGKVVFYKPNFNNDYTFSYLSFLLEKEAQESIPRIKRWVTDLKSLKELGLIGILFGSVITKENYNDIDLILVLEQPSNVRVNKLIDNLNKISTKRIHLVKQSLNDFKSNLLKQDKVILNALKTSIIIFGYDKFIEVMSSVINKQQD